MSEWINVKDGFPEEDTTVLIFTDGIITTGKYCSEEMGKWGSYHPFKFDVTHWMELPTPPKEESKITIPRSFEAMGEKG